MQSSALRLGNVVAAIDAPQQADYVLILEPGTVHLMERAEADDEQNIIPVAANPDTLARFDIPCGQAFLLSDKLVSIEARAEQMHLQVNDLQLPFTYIHELQNLLHAICGEEIIRHPHIQAAVAAQ